MANACNDQKVCRKNLGASLRPNAASARARKRSLTAVLGAQEFLQVPHWTTISRTGSGTAGLLRMWHRDTALSKLEVRDSGFVLNSTVRDSPGFVPGLRLVVQVTHVHLIS